MRPIAHHDSPQKPQPREPEAWLPRLLTLLEHQQSLAARLEELALRQSALITSAQTDALLQVLAARQEIVDQFLHSQRELQVMTEELETRLRDVPAERAQRIRALLAEVSEALGRVMAQDQRDEQALSQAREATRRELAPLGALRAAQAAYSQTPPAANRFADQRG